MDTVKFTQMKDGDKEDYELLTKHEFDFNKKTADRLLKVMVTLDESLSGYKVTRLEHSIQSATRAWRDGADVDWALGAAIVHSIKKKSVIVVSDGIESYDTFKPTFMTVTFEMIGLIVAIAFLYMCFCRRLILGFGKQGLSSSTDGIGNGILGSANKLV